MLRISNTGQQLVPVIAGNYFDNLSWVTSQILLRHIEATCTDQSIYRQSGIPMTLCAVRKCDFLFLLFPLPINSFSCLLVFVLGMQ